MDRRIDYESLYFKEINKKLEGYCNGNCDNCFKECVSNIAQVFLEEHDCDFEKAYFALDEVEL